MASRLAFIGSRDLAQLLAVLALQSPDFEEVVGFFDDFREVGESTPNGPILGNIDSVTTLYESGRFDTLLVAIGYKHLEFKKRCFEQFAGIVPFATIIGPSCHLDPSVVVGPGTAILPGCVLDQGVKVAGNCLFNVGVVVAHDSTVGSSTFLGPSVSLAGFVSVGSECFLGINSTVIDNVEICDRAQVGAGAVVVKNIDSAGLYLGLPAVQVRAF